MPYEDDIVLPPGSGKDYNADILRIYERMASEGKTPGEAEFKPAYKTYEPPPTPDRTQNLAQNADYKEGMRRWQEGEYRQQQDRGAKVRGPLGEELPYGAEAWDANGRPFYGGSFAGIWNKFISRLTAPMEQEKWMTVEPGAIAGTKPGGGRFNILDAPKIAAAGYSNLIKTWENFNSGSLGRLPAILSRITGGTVEGVLNTLGETEKVTEQAISYGLEAGAQASYATMGEKARNFYGNDLTMADLSPSSPRNQAWRQFVNGVDPATLNVKPKYISAEELKERRTQAWWSGRVLYTGAVDADVRQKYIKKFEAGENPYLIALEMENPAAEIVGTMLLSPWNIVAPIAHSLRDTSRTAGVYDDFLKTAPEIEAFLKTAGKADDVGSVERTIKAVDTIRKSVAKVKTGSAETAINTASRFLTQDGKRFYMDRRLGELVQGIVYNNDMDDALDSFEALYRIASDNPEEISLGLMAVKELPMPNALTSRVGQETGVILRKIIGETKEEWDDFAKVFAKVKDEGEMAKVMGAKLDNALADMYPNFSDLQNAAKAVSKATKPVDERTARLAAMYAQKPWLYKGIGNFHNLAQAKIYRPINSFFNAIYMGFSFSYGTKNIETNTVGVLVDGGAGALRYKPATWLERTKRYLGGAAPELMSGFSKGTLGVDVATPKRKLLFGNLMAELGEEASAKQIVGKTVQDEMHKMLKVGRAIPDTRPLVEAGMPPEAAKTLGQIIVTEYGDVDAAVTKFLDAYKTGRVDLFRSLGFLPDETVKSLKQFGVWDEIVDIAKNGADNEAGTVKQRIQAVFDDVFNDALRIDDEVATVDIDAPGAEAIIHSLEDVGNGTQTVATNAVQANKVAIESGTQAALKTIEGAAAEAVSKGDQKGIESVQKLHAEFQQSMAAMVDSNNVAGKWGDDWHSWKEVLDAAHDTTKPETAWATLAQQADLPDVFDATPPDNWADLNRRFWEEYFYPLSNAKYAPARAMLKKSLDNISEALGMNPMIQRARVDIQTADDWQGLVTNYQKSRFAVQDAIARGDIPNAVRFTAEQFGIPHRAPSGALLDKRLVDTVNKYLETSYTVDDLRAGKISVADAKKAFGLRQKAYAEKAAAAAEPGAVKAAEAVPEEVAQAVLPIPPKPPSDTTPSMARVLTEQRDGLEGLMKQVLDGVDANWGKYQPVAFNKTIETQLAQWAKQAKSQVGEARILAAAVADEARKFTLLSYPEKTYFDLAMAYIYPYQFWYSRTYLNWLKRIAINPDVIAGYARYKDGLAKIHAGSPDWWKYNINSNELLGRDDENPMYFNLEATLNPLNGITGVDFTDPYKRVDWFTSMVDDMGKFGPSMWTPINMGIATVFHLKGQQELASRWGGRLIPQTAALKSALSMANVNTRTMKGINEFDPNVLIFSGGQDPYERRRTAVQLYEMQREGLITQEEADETAYYQDNQTWYDATARGIRKRAPGQLSGFFVGVGFKGRNQSDIELDMFDQENRRLISLRNTMTAEEYKQARAELNAKYPYADAVLLARKGGDERDTTYAYNILGRIPPGQKDDMLELVGITREGMNKFYESKGEMSGWPESDRARFMAAVVDLGGYFQLPDDATKAEWDAASKSYREMAAEGQRMYGDEIWDLESQYYNMRSGEKSERDKADVFLERTPGLQAAMDWKAQQINRNDLLRQYYGSIESVERYYTGMMYDAISDEVGEDIFDLWDEYYEIKLADTKAAAKFYKQYEKRFDRYREMKGNLSEMVASTIARMGANVKEASYPELRPRTQTSVGQQALDEYFAGQNEPTPYEFDYSDWQGLVSQNMERLLVDYFNGQELSYSARDQAEYIANGLDIPVDVMLDLIKQSYYEQ